MLDTVRHRETGLLGKTENDLVENICHLLQNPETAFQMGRNGEAFVRQRYHYERITKEWIDLFNRLSNNRRPKYIPFKKNIFAHWKWAIIINSFLQKTIGEFLPWPSMKEIKSFLRPEKNHFTSKLDH